MSKPPPTTPTLASKSTTKVVVFYHEPGDRGPRHARFPEINVSATAHAHGMSKSQLSRLLNGDNCPSMKSLWLLSAILGKPVEVVAEMYKVKRVKPNLKPKEKRKSDAESQLSSRRKPTRTKHAAATNHAVALRGKHPRK